jgi:hypothetical protein
VRLQHGCVFLGHAIVDGTASPAQFTRLWVRAGDLPELRARAAEANPFYGGGLTASPQTLTRIPSARAMDALVIRHSVAEEASRA